jgi:ATP-dependent 26S proteasome regulatory subunit
MIYIPSDMSDKIASPTFISLMIDNPNSILIIEDAENTLRDRIKGDNNSVANLLNFSDGLLSDCLNIQIICTFNTDISCIDQALLRKGRIIAKYEFKPLVPDKTKNLLHKLYNNNNIVEEMTLAEIYNKNSQSFNDKKFSKIGFN